MLQYCSDNDCWANAEARYISDKVNGHDIFNVELQLKLNVSFAKLTWHTFLRLLLPAAAVYDFETINKRLVRDWIKN